MDGNILAAKPGGKFAAIWPKLSAVLAHVSAISADVYADRPVLSAILAELSARSADVSAVLA